MTATVLKLIHNWIFLSQAPDCWRFHCFRFIILVHSAPLEWFSGSREKINAMFISPSTISNIGEDGKARSFAFNFAGFLEIHSTSVLDLDRNLNIGSCRRCSFREIQSVFQVVHHRQQHYTGCPGILIVKMHTL